MLFRSRTAGETRNGTKGPSYHTLLVCVQAPEYVSQWRTWEGGGVDEGERQTDEMERGKAFVTWAIKKLSAL